MKNNPPRPTYLISTSKNPLKYPYGASSLWYLTHMARRSKFNKVKFEEKNYSKIMKKNKIKKIFPLIAIAAFFILISYFSTTYSDSLKSVIEEYPDILAILIYVLGLIISTILGPISLLPILPLAITLWGSIITVILTTIGYTIGAMIAFSLSKKYGRDLVEKLVDLKQLNWIEEKIPKKNLFAAVVGFRIIIPFDFVSYALGLFTNMKLLPFTMATFIGSLFSTLIIVYAIKLPTWIQISFVVLVVILLILGYFRTRK